MPGKHSAGAAALEREMAGFAIGDRVCLKSGGPAMTIDTVDGTTIGCVWFIKDRRHSGYFPAACLDHQVLALTEN
jgi:uncharacterized protein YodC (DUF2158 family)